MGYRLQPNRRGMDKIAPKRTSKVHKNHWGGAVIEQTKHCVCVGMLGGKYEKMHDMSRRVYDPSGCAPTQHTVGGGNLETKIIDPMETIESDYKVRKLTERECFRLMGVKDEDFDKLRHNQSKSKLYHLAGDSIVVPCLMAIFGQMLDVDWEQKIKEVTQCETKSQN